MYNVQLQTVLVSGYVIKLKTQKPGKKKERKDEDLFTSVM